jgi:hypothetical protein
MKKKYMTVRKREKGTFELRRMSPMWRMHFAGALGAENVSTILILKMDQSWLREAKSMPTSPARTSRATTPCRWMISPTPLRSSTLGPAIPPSLFTSLDRGGVRGDKPAAVEVHPMAALANRAAGVAAGEDEQADGTESRKQADDSYPAAAILE